MLDISNVLLKRALIEKFLEFWLEYNPDIITGWNVKFFDIPFLMNRFRRLMGDEYILTVLVLGM